MPALGVIQLQSRLPASTLLPEDVFENVIHIGLEQGTWGGGHLTLMMEAFRDFYTQIPPLGSLSLGTRISEAVSRTADACSIVAYDTDDLSGNSPMGSPIGSLNFTMPTAGAGSGLPEEVAVICSYHGDLTNVPVTQANPAPPPATIRPAQRRRGRLYLGPLQANAGQEASSQFRPVVQLRNELGYAFKDLCNTVKAIDPVTEQYYVGVWSKADEEVWEAVGGYVDDAWDTQRRRGLAPTIRNSFVV